MSFIEVSVCSFGSLNVIDPNKLIESGITRKYGLGVVVALLDEVYYCGVGLRGPICS